MNTYIVIGVYAEPETHYTDADGPSEHFQRFAYPIEAADPEAAERGAMLWADAEIIIAGTVEVWNPRGFTYPSDLAEQVGYAEDQSADALIGYKDALEDELRSTIETATCPPRVH